VTVRNTVFSGRGPENPIYIGATSTLIADHNLYYLPQNEIILVHGDVVYTCDNIGTIGEGNQCGDPRFVHQAWGEIGDYHLLADSPGRGTGTSNGMPNDDLEGKPRPSLPDLGAYQSQ